MNVSSYCGKKDILNLRSTDDRFVCVGEKQAAEPLLLHRSARSPRVDPHALGIDATTELGLQEPVALRLTPPPPVWCV